MLPRASTPIRTPPHPNHHHPPSLPCSDALHAGSPFLRQLCYFANPADAWDVQLLGTACALVLASKAAAPGESQGLELCAQAGRGQEARAAAAQRVQRLVELSLRALALHAGGAFAQQLAAPRQGGAAAGGSAAAALLEAAIALTGALKQNCAAWWGAAVRHCLFCAADLQGLRLLHLAFMPRWPGPITPTGMVGDPRRPERTKMSPTAAFPTPHISGAEPWKPFVPAAEASALGAQVLAHLVWRGLFPQLAAILAAACPEPPAPAVVDIGAPAAPRPAVPAGEALATALVVRYLALQGARHSERGWWGGGMRLAACCVMPSCAFQRTFDFKDKAAGQRATRSGACRAHPAPSSRSFTAWRPPQVPSLPASPSPPAAAPGRPTRCRPALPRCSACRCCASAAPRCAPWRGGCGTSRS